PQARRATCFARKPFELCGRSRVRPSDDLRSAWQFLATQCRAARIPHRLHPRQVGFRVVIVANQMAPGGATIEDFGDPVINRHGQVAVIGLLTNSASRRGVFVGDGTDAVAIALDGQLAPKGDSYTDSGLGAFPGPLRLNDRGEVAFDARLT